MEHHDDQGPLRKLSKLGYAIGAVSTERGIVKVNLTLRAESAWVEIGQQSRDLAAGKITLADISDAAARARK